MLRANTQATAAWTAWRSVTPRIFLRAMQAEASGRSSARLSAAGRRFTWNPNSNFGDPHSTICVLEGFSDTLLAAHPTQDQLPRRRQTRLSFCWRNKLFFSGEQRYRMLAYPFRYGMIFCARWSISRCSVCRSANRCGLRWTGSGASSPAKDSGTLDWSNRGAVHFPLETRGSHSDLSR